MDMKLVLHYVALVVHICTCLFLIGVVLLQQGKGQDLASAFGGGVTQTAFGPRGSANLLSRLTTILAGVFMVTSLALSVLQPRSQSGIENLPAAPAPAATTAPAPAAPTNSSSESTAPSNSVPAPADKAPASKPSASSDKPGVTRPLTDKDVGPNAK
jgi:preprotein translocase subunit SecG